MATRGGGEPGDPLFRPARAYIGRRPCGVHLTGPFGDEHPPKAGQVQPDLGSPIARQPHHARQSGTKHLLRLHVLFGRQERQITISDNQLANANFTYEAP